MTRPRIRVCLVGLAALTLCSCASAPRSRAADPTPAIPPAPTDLPRVNAHAPSSEAEPLTRRTPDGKTVVLRPALRRLHGRGPHWLLERVTVRPQLKRGRFRGWRIVRYTGPGKLSPGDVVLRVNGNAMERPEQFMQAWTELPTRDKLVIELLQQGKRRKLQFDVVDQ